MQLTCPDMLVGLLVNDGTDSFDNRAPIGWALLPAEQNSQFFQNSDYSAYFFGYDYDDIIYQSASTVVGVEYTLQFTASTALPVSSNLDVWIVDGKSSSFAGVSTVFSWNTPTYQYPPSTVIQLAYTAGGATTTIAFGGWGGVIVRKVA